MEKNIILKFTAESDMGEAAAELQRLKDREKELMTEMGKLTIESNKQVEAIKQTVTEQKKQADSVEKVRQNQAKQQQALEGEFKKTQNTIMDFVRKMNNVNETIGKGAQQTPKFTTQLRMMKDELAKMEEAGISPTDKSFIKLAVSAAKLEDQVGDTRQRIRILSSDTKNLDAAMSVGQGLAGGFTAATSAAALLGSESEELQKAFFKVQAVLQVLNGVQMVANTLNKDSEARVVIGTALQKADTTAKQANTVATTAQSTATKAATIATKGFGLALKSLGIGLVISAIAFLVTKWDDLKGALNRILPAGKSIEKMFDRVKSVAVGVGNAVVQYLVMPFKALGQVLQGDFSGAIKTIGSGLNLVSNYKKGALEQDARNAQNARNQDEAEQIKADKRQLERLENQGKNVYSQKLALLNREKTLMERQKKDTSEIQKEIEDLQDKHHAEIASKRQQAAQQAAQAAKAQAEREKQEQEKRNQQVLDAQEERQNQEIRLMKEGFDKARAEINLKYQRFIDDIKSRVKEVGELSQAELDLIAGYEKERVNELEKAHNLQRMELKTFNTDRIDASKITAKQLTDIVKQSTDEQIALLKQEEEARKEMYQAMFDFGSELINLAFDMKRESFEREMENLENRYISISEWSKMSAADKAKNVGKEIISEQALAAKKLEIKRKQAQAEKQQAMFNIALGTAQAVMNALQTKPFFPFGLAMAAMAGVLGAAQAITVASKPLPKYAKGRKGGKGEFAQVGELGPEIMWVPDGASIIPANRKLTPETLAEFRIPLPVLDDRLVENVRLDRKFFIDYEKMKFDYDKLSNAIAKNMKEKHISINVDKSGITVQNGNSTTTFLNKKYRGNW